VSAPGPRSIDASASTFERGFLPTIAIVGGLIILGSLWQLSGGPIDERWFVLLGLTALSGSATLRLPGTPVSFSISDSFTMASALLFGPAAGTVTVAIDSLVISMRLARRPIPTRRVVFNATAPPLAMWIAAQAFFLIAGAGPMASTKVSPAHLIGSVTIFAGLFFILNTGLIALAIAFEQRVRAVAIWREHFLGLWLTYFGGAAVAALLVVLVQQRHPDVLALVLLTPVPFIIYAAFRNTVGRMEDRVGHLNQVNGMYLSTIETLAQAIDAKDQVTHGHIRRVQENAVKLAHALGIDDDAQLRALEAASLLHDVGKLAVPDHILNKPSSLTPTEFENMKRHANVGADILEAIGFPYPVVPIVRHHHENWDGTGYPAGLAAEQIPVGARILSVVDCFDALTSDRPYRTRLSPEEALRVVRARSGTMYDPRVVSTFVTMLENSPPVVELPVTTAPQGLSDIAGTAHHDMRRSLASRGDAEAFATLFELGVQAATAATVGEALSRIHAILRNLMPADVCALYVHDAETDTLAATSVSGVHAPAIVGTTIRVGQRLSGWVAANRQTIVNSEAALDLGNLTMRLDPPPLRCLSTAICTDGELSGVLTLYSTRRQPFTEAHVPMIEAVAIGLGNLLRVRHGAAMAAGETNVLTIEPARVHRLH
jgi:putative nucleotidyltransferase with HDIG domain